MGEKVGWSPYLITIIGPPRGQIKAIDDKCNDIPDTATTLAVAVLFANGQTAIRDVYDWRVKETERMKAFVAELTKLGARVEEWRDYCVIAPREGGKINENVRTDTHRRIDVIAWPRHFRLHLCHECTKKYSQHILF